jgi:alpha-glucosidase
VEGLDASSILHLYHRLLAARRASPALAGGDIALLTAPEGVLAYERRLAGDRRVVVVNFSDDPVDVFVGSSWTVEVASDGSGEGGSYSGTLGASTALLLAPA